MQYKTQCPYCKKDIIAGARHRVKADLWNHVIRDHNRTWIMAMFVLQLARVEEVQ